MNSESRTGELGGSGNGQPIGTGGGKPDRPVVDSTKTFDWNVPEGVVCPACFGELRALKLAMLRGSCQGELGAGKETLVCDACGRRYPVLDGIPVLIVERAEQG